MDINALYDREVAYYSGRPVVVYLPSTLQELTADVLITRNTTGVKTTITAPYSPIANQTISSLKVLNKPPGSPVSYSGLFTSSDTATLTPAPQFLVGQLVTIGQNTYSVVSITGSSVKFERSITELLVYVAQVVTDSVTYQWQILNGSTWTDLIGETARTYDPQPSDVGKELRVVITYTDGRGEVGESSSTAPSFIPNQTLSILPVFPVIAEITLDVERTYTPNSLNTFVIEIDNI